MSSGDFSDFLLHASQHNCSCKHTERSMETTKCQTDKYNEEETCSLSFLVPQITSLADSGNQREHAADISH